MVTLFFRALGGELGPTGGKLGSSSSLPVYLIPTTRNRRRGAWREGGTFDLKELEGGKHFCFELEEGPTATADQ